MPLTMRPTGLGSGIDKHLLITLSTLARGMLVHLRDPRRSRQSALVLVDDVNGPMTRSDRVATLGCVKESIFME